jgi:hsp70-interacting protein
VERLKIGINKIKDEKTPDQQKEEFLDELCHWTEELDLAKDFFSVGGSEILVLLLNHPNDQMRLKTCSLIATLVQNNDHGQRIVVQSGLQEKLLQIVDKSTNVELQTKAVTAISGLPLL